MSSKKNYSRSGADHQDAQCDGESMERLDIGNHSEDGIPNQAPRTRCDTRIIDGEIDPCLSGH